MKGFSKAGEGLAYLDVGVAGDCLPWVCLVWAWLESEVCVGGLMMEESEQLDITLIFTHT